MDNKQQAAWISAGQSIQTISRVGHGSVQETQVKVMRTVTKEEPEALNSPIAVAKTQEQDENKAEPQNNKPSTPQPTTAGTPAAAQQRYLVKRTMNSTPTHMEVRECYADRVLSRRMNVKRKMFEYMVKWFDYENTWEPANHFDKAHEMLAECERKLAKQKAAQAAAVAAAGGAASPATNQAAAIAGIPGGVSVVRTTKAAKPLATTNAAAAAANELKRKNTDSDSTIEAAESSQDESFTSTSSPSKMMKGNNSVQIISKVVGGQVKYYQKVSGGEKTNKQTTKAGLLR